MHAGRTLGATVVWLTVVAVGCGNGGPSTSLTSGRATTTTIPATTTTTTLPATSVASTLPATSVASTTTRAPTTTAPSEEFRVLRPDGIGPHDFGEEMSVVVAWATALLGPAVFGAMPESIVPNIMSVCPNQENVHWTSAALDLYFADWEFDEEGLIGCTGTKRLVAWGVGSYGSLWCPRCQRGTSPTPATIRLVTADGIGVGTTVAALVDLGTDPSFMRWPDLGVFPAGFLLGDPLLDKHLFGVLAWDWVRALQAALGDYGARLVVDGQLGPNTRAALDRYRADRGLSTAEAAILELALVPGDDVRVASLTSGRWALEFECGTLAGYGLETC